MHFLRKTLFLLLIPFGVFAQNPVKPDQHAMHALHDDPKAYIAALEDPNRENYQKPNDVLDALALKPGEVVADIGAGSGYFTIRFSNALKESGKVYAVDVSQDMIDYMNRRFQETNARNVTTVLSSCGRSSPAGRLCGSDLYLRYLASYRKSPSISCAIEKSAASRWANHHDRFSEEGTSRRSTGGYEDCSRRSHSTDGVFRLSPRPGAYLPALSVFSGLHGAVSVDSCGVIML